MLVTELAHDGDPGARELLELIGRRLGVGIANFVNVFNPEVVVVGGGVMARRRAAAGAGPGRGGRAGPGPGSRQRAHRGRRAGAGGGDGGSGRDGLGRAGRGRVSGAGGGRVVGAGGVGAGGAGAGRLVVCPTPIGNLEDVTLRVLAALRDADVVACEDTRRTRVLLDRYGVSARLVSYHEHNEERRARELVERMRAGEVVALVSDAGMPLVSDPGFVLVRACVAAGLAVEVLPGPSAALAALVASGAAGPALALRGLPAAPARGAGGPPELPPRRWSRSNRPRRVAATLAVLARAGRRPPGRRVPRADQAPRGGGARHGVRAGRPLRGRAAARRGGAGGRPGGGGRGRARARGGRRWRRLVEAGARPRAAAKVVAELTGVSANELYGALTARLSRLTASDRGRLTDGPTWAL